MKTPTTKLMLAAVAMTIGLCANAETANTVKVTKFHQSYPYSGKATVEYTVGGTLPANAIAEFTISTDDTNATFKQKNIVTGANTNVIGFASSFGGALLLTNASFVVTITEEELGGVQLWENGPYWAECNVGATEPEEYGYYFWWGDTVGYKRDNNAWVASDGSTSNFSFNSDNTPTEGKDNSALRSEGYIDSTGNLVAEHDAATAHLGAPWRMPTCAEFEALKSNCTTEWTTQNGVNGLLVTGKGAYADKSIFLPAAGRAGYKNYWNYPGSDGYYRSSTSKVYSPEEPMFDMDDSYETVGLVFWSQEVSEDSLQSRWLGLSVRPVR